MIKAIKIDVTNRTVSVVEMDPSKKMLEQFYQHIECDCMTAVGAPGLLKEDLIYVDDNGLLTDHPKPFFKWKTYPQALAGNGLIVGSDDEGGNVDAATPLETVKRMVLFLGELEPARRPSTRHTVIIWNN